MTSIERLAREEGEKIGIEKGEKTGIEKGEARGGRKNARKMVLDLVEALFLEVPEDISMKINTMDNPQELSILLKQVPFCGGIDGLRKIIEGLESKQG